ncbi:MAG: hypothetical protein FWF59_07570 [Turicibacter sp.]|nr:hypothetical protein [Turicibacter sp.]
MMNLTRKEEKLFNKIKGATELDKGKKIRTILLGLVLIVVSIALFFLPEDQNPLIVDGDRVLTWILGGAGAVIGLLFLLSGLSTNNALAWTIQDFERITGNHGELDENIADFVKSFISDGGVLAKTEENGFVTQSWYYTKVPGGGVRLVHLSDVVAVFGDTRFGSHLVLNDGTVISEMFGRGQWSHVFNVFVSGNPHIIGGEDMIEVPGEGVVEAHGLFYDNVKEWRGQKGPQSQAIKFIVQAYNARLQGIQ